MSEVVSQILVFAIVTGVFVLSMLAFKAAQESTRDRVVQVRADSTAARIASAIVQAGALVEEQGSTVRVSFLLDLPQDLDGLAYQVAIVVPGGTQSATLAVTVPSRGITATAPLFAIEALSGLVLCPTSVPGGALFARFSDTPPGACAAPSIYLEAAP